MARRRQRRRVGRRRVMRRGRGRKLVMGGMIRGRMHPQSNTASPWNNYVVTFQWTPSPPAQGKPFVNMQDITVVNIGRIVLAELGLSGDIDMRIRRLDVWTQPQTSNSTRNTIVMAPFDWTSCSGVLNWFESWGTAVQPAHCHYIWPRSISNEVLIAGRACPVVRFDVRDGNFAFIVKVHLMWRKNAPKPLTVSGVITSLRTTVVHDEHHSDPPSETDYITVDKEAMAMSPLATVVGALGFRA